MSKFFEMLGEGGTSIRKSADSFKLFPTVKPIKIDGRPGWVIDYENILQDARRAFGGWKKVVADEKKRRLENG